MAKFIYRMQNILDLKEKLETQARNDYAVAQAELNEEEEKLPTLLTYERLGLVRLERAIETTDEAFKAAVEAEGYSVTGIK